MKQKVALVLASGGARGLAHIGAIDELEKRGFEITSVSGSSIGSLIGGIYSAGGLDIFKEWMKSIDRVKLLTLLDFTISTDGFVKGQKLIKELKKMVPDKQIEELNIPFCAVATDIKHRKEAVLDRGHLYDAIRASISLPSLFKPYKIDDMLLIDGGVVNPIPLDRVKRTPGDILVAVDLNAPYMHKAKKQPKTLAQIEAEISFFKKLNIPAFTRAEALLGIAHRGKDTDDGDQLAFADKRDQMSVTATGIDTSAVRIKDAAPKQKAFAPNYYDIVTASTSMMIQANSERSIALNRPDILIRIPKNAYSTMEFYKYEEIVEMGRKATIKALEESKLI